jgi:RND family efflux transporter MFP subunit
MNSSKNKKRSSSKRLILILAAVVVLVGAGAGYYFFLRPQASAQASASASSANQLHTTAVRRGDLILSASGTGSLTASQTVNLSFSTGGTVAAVNVQVGDQVKAGDPLASLQDIDSLKANVLTAQLNLISAQKTLEDFKNNAGQALAQAQLNVADAQKAYDDAKANLKEPGLARCDTDTTNAYYDQYLQLQTKLNSLGDGGGNADYYLNIILPVKQAMDKAYISYTYCAGFTDYEIKSSQATLTKTQMDLKTAQDTLATLEKNNGLDPDTLALDQNAVDSAQVALDKAQKTLDGATLKAPFDGTVTAVAGQVGDTVGTDTFITIADLAHPYVSFYVDETDLSNVAIGHTAQVTFDALPNQTFNGTVVQLDPQLVTTGNSQALGGLIKLDMGTAAQGKPLPAGLSAAVEVIGGEARNALLVPVEALRDLGGGQYGVFVLGSDGKLRLQVVQVGLEDLTYAEIKSGLNLGDVVSTGATEVK